MRHNGTPHLALRDHLQLSSRIALIPEPLVPLLAAMDGQRDYDQLVAAFAEQVGLLLPPDVARSIAAQLDEALLLDSPRLSSAVAAARAAFRAGPHRAVALAPTSYPADPDALQADLDALCPTAVVTRSRRKAEHGAGAPAGAAIPAPLLPQLTLPLVQPLGPIQRAAGVLSPHIDYARGGRVYGATWAATVEAVHTAEVVVVFGTDHHGSPARLTPTAQRYATPWGAFPSDPDAVRAVASAAGEEVAYAEELHHTREHSIELATVWLHWALRRAAVNALPPLVPVLCGSFHCYTHAEAGGASPTSDPVAEATVDALAAALAGRRVLVVSAADLAHMGPAFGDASPLAAGDKRALTEGDARLLKAAGSGQAATFLTAVQDEQDRRRVCGLPPTYWALRLLERLTGRPTAGRVAGYDVCPADARAGSVVSIAGMLWE